MKSIQELFGLRGKTALVTGSASGIGQGIALGLAEAGADIIGTCHKTPWEETAGLIRAAGGSYEPVQTDLGDMAQRSDFIHDVLERYEKIDILVNCTGNSRLNPIDHFDFNDYYATMELNLNAPLALSAALAARWIERGVRGRIINITSLIAFTAAHIQAAPYCVSKHGLLGLTRSLAFELAAYGITVNAIAPGFVHTKLTAPNQKFEEAYQPVIDRVPLKRWGYPEDLKGIAVLLASEAGAFITGQNMVVDGGFTLE